MSTDPRVMEILQQAKKLAQEYRTYRQATRHYGEAEYEAARLLKLELTPARNEGYDAIERLPGRLQLAAG